MPKFAVLRSTTSIKGSRTIAARTAIISPFSPERRTRSQWGNGEDSSAGAVEPGAESVMAWTVSPPAWNGIL